ncbi:hypothetical protein TNCV_2867061 [Trichonephila clavipes]|nr:hypothetical protein TNCV_2867061 [Trichonephila clavipes]
MAFEDGLHNSKGRGNPVVKAIAAFTRDKGNLNGGFQQDSKDGILLGESVIRNSADVYGGRLNAYRKCRHALHVGRANGNGRAALRMYLAQCLDRRIPYHRMFQLLHRQLSKTHVRSSSPEMMLIDEEL